MFNTKKSFKQTFSSRGFTLIELLIVIAILGTLAVVVLVALNPVQQLARTRDAGRLSAVTQIGHSIEAYATSNSGGYPPTAGCTANSTTTWLNCLLNASEISSVPGKITNNLGDCSGNVVNGWCYNLYGTGARAIVYSRLEGNANINRCNTGMDAYAVYSTANSRGGIVCVASGGSPADPGATGYATCTTSPCTTANQFLP